MQNATALFCADVTTPDDAIQTAARDAAKHNAHLAVLLYAHMPIFPMAGYGALPYGGIAAPEAWSDKIAQAQAALKDRVEAVEKLLSQEDASADVRPLFSTVGDVRQGLSQASRSCDIAFISQDLRQKEGLYTEMLHTVLFHSPIAVVVNGTLDLAHDTILLAWDNSLTGARSAHLALPYLKNASNVHIVCFDAPATDSDRKIEPGREVALWLSHHGCDVTLTQLPSGGREIGACILDHTAEIGADLVVAGAYGHSRLHQAVFGGTSRTLIEQDRIPIFMAH